MGRHFIGDLGRKGYFMQTERVSLFNLLFNSAAPSGPQNYLFHSYSAFTVYSTHCSYMKYFTEGSLCFLNYVLRHPRNTTTNLQGHYHGIF